MIKVHNGYENEKILGKGWTVSPLVQVLLDKTNSKATKAYI